MCRWSAASEESLPLDGQCAFGYAKRSKSLAALREAFEVSVAANQKDPSDFKVSDPLRGRADLQAIKPGNYRIVWIYEGGGDCGYSEHLVDNDTVLRVTECKYRHTIERLTRHGVAVPSDHATASTVQAIQGAKALPTGRWQGTVTQGFNKYSTEIQLALTPAGVLAGTVSYSSLCTASLTYLRTEDSTYWFRETLQKGRGACVDGGLVSVSPTGDAVTYRYHTPSSPSKPIASGVLRRN
jgi:hypothetical protein